MTCFFKFGSNILIWEIFHVSFDSQAPYSASNLFNTETKLNSKLTWTWCYCNDIWQMSGLVVLGGVEQLELGEDLVEDQLDLLVLLLLGGHHGLVVPPLMATGWVSNTSKKQINDGLFDSSIWCSPLRKRAHFLAQDKFFFKSRFIFRNHWFL